MSVANFRGQGRIQNAESFFHQENQRTLKTTEHLCEDLLHVVQAPLKAFL